jgi:hypothetical protein
MQDPAMQNTPNNSIQAALFIKPDYASSFENAGKQFKVFWKTLLLVAVANLIVGLLLQIPYYFGIFDSGFTYQTPVFPSFSDLGLFGLFLIVTSIIYIVISYGYILASLKAARAEKPSIKDLFRPFTRFFPVIFSAILLTLIIFVGFLFLIVPGIFFLCRLAYTPYLVVDKNKGVFNAMSGSWKMTKGHFWTIFLIGLSVLGIEMVLSLVLFVVFFSSTGGDLFQMSNPNMWAYQIIFSIIFLPVGIFISLVFGSLYHAIKIKKHTETQTELEGQISPDSAP